VLHVSCYGGEFTDPSKTTKTKGYRSWHFRSDDDGSTWKRVSTIHPTGNETTLLHLGGKRWMAAARERAMDLFVSEDDGETWREPVRVTEKNRDQRPSGAPQGRAHPAMLWEPGEGSIWRAGQV